VAYAKLTPEMGPLLVLTGITAALIGAWQSYAAARGALAPLIRPGEPTRSAVEAAQPIHVRTRVRLFARRLATSLAWLLLSFYGLFLASVGSVAR